MLASAEPLGRVIGAVVGTLGARDIVLIGDMTDYGEPWLERIRDEVRRSALPLLAQRATVRIGRYRRGRPKSRRGTRKTLESDRTSQESSVTNPQN